MKHIVKSAILEDSDLSHLSERMYFRVGCPGSGMKVSQLPLRALETVYVANHPDYIAQGGEKRSRLDWCDRCDSYQPVDGMLSCESCPRMTDSFDEC